jgi:hypothetical protein
MGVYMGLVECIGQCEFCRSDVTTMFMIEGTGYGDSSSCVWMCKQCLEKVVKAEKKIENSELIDY